MYFLFYYFTIATVCKYHSNPKLAFIATSCNLTVIHEYCLMSVAILWPPKSAIVVAIKWWIEILLLLIIIFFILDFFVHRHIHTLEFWLKLFNTLMLLTLMWILWSVNFLYEDNVKSFFCSLTTSSINFVFYLLLFL